LICRFCDQWNPDGAARCVFCNNSVDAKEDLSASDPGSRTLPPLTVPKIQEDQWLPIFGKDLVLSRVLWQGFIALVVILFVTCKLCGK
jgi:hypothetical protein